MGRIDDGSTVQPLSPLVVLYDQTANINLNAASQNFEAANDAFDNQAADDFVVTGGGGWNVTSVFAPGVYSTTHGTPTSMRVAFYADAGGNPGAIVCDFPTAAFVEGPAGSFTITLPGGCILSPGTKWVSVVANMAFGGGGGQWFWSTRTVLTGNPSRWQNPGGGFGTGCTTWGTRTTCLGQTDPDMAFRLDGSIASCTINADCADGNLCNGIETCSAGSCQPGTPLTCSDGLNCTLDVCNPATGACSNPPNPCSDGDSCTVDSCTEAGGCAHTTPATVRFCNTGAISIPTGGTATPYPSPVVVTGVPTSGSVCSVELVGITHTFPDDIDVMLAGPLGGASPIVMSDVGGSTAVTGVNLILKDAAATALPDAGALVSGTFKPTNVGAGDTFPAPAPPQGGSSLSVYNNTNTNGTWNLFVVDQFTPDGGSFSGGWCINITPNPCSSNAQCNDGNPCNGSETCAAGSCQPGTPLICDDSLFCTEDACNPANGECVFTPNPCDDGNTCTVDSCTEANGCFNDYRCAQFCSFDTVTIADSATPPTAGSPYPSIIAVSGVDTSATLVSVDVQITHTFPDDIELLLVGPAGPAQNAILMSDAGGITPASNVSVSFTDQASVGIPDGGPLVDGLYRLTNIGAGDTFPAPAPAPSAATTLAAGFGASTNGSWSLYVADDAAEDSGSIPAWCVNFLLPGCTVNAQCDDGNPCTDDTCSAGTCTFANNTASCDDGNPCTAGETCGGGACLPGSPITPPAELAGVAAPDKVTVTWTGNAQSTSYDGVRASISALPLGPGAGDEVCFPNLLSPSLTDTDVPASGTGYGYLSRGKNSCGAGTYGTQSNGTPRTTTTCP